MMRKFYFLIFLLIGSTVSIAQTTINDRNTTSDISNAGDIENSVDNTSETVAVKNWTGNVDNNWFNGANWSTGTVPNRVDDAIIDPSSNPPVINGNARIGSLTLFDTVIVQTGSLRVRNTVNGDNGSLRIESGASLLTRGNITGSNHTVIRNTTFDENTGRYSVIGTPVNTANTSQLGSLVYGYDETIPYGANGNDRFFLVENATMAVGDAFFSAFTGTVTFTGTPNTGNIEVPLVYNVAQDNSDAGFNLVSNPYPSAIDIIEFIFDNTDAVESEIYIWDDDNPQGTRGDNSDYLIVNSLGAAGSNGNNYNGFVGTAQGFFVKANRAGASLSFENDQRVRDSNADDNFFRTRGGELENKRERLEDIQKIKLNVVDEGSSMYNSIIIGFLRDASNGDDPLYDALKFSANTDFQLFTYIEDEKYAIQGLPLISDDVIVPLGLTLGSAGNYQFNLEEVVNLPENISVYILDTSTNSYTEIKKDSPYNFSSDAVSEDGRFNLVFTENSTLSLGDENLDSAKLRVFSTDNRITVKLDNGISIPSAKITINDVLGRTVLTRDINEAFNSYEINHTFADNNIYLVKVESELGTTIKKLIIK